MSILKKSHENGVPLRDGRNFLESLLDYFLAKSCLRKFSTFSQNDPAKATRLSRKHKNSGKYARPPGARAGRLWRKCMDSQKYARPLGRSIFMGIDAFAGCRENTRIPKNMLAPLGPARAACGENA